MLFSHFFWLHNCKRLHFVNFFYSASILLRNSYFLWYENMNFIAFYSHLIIKIPNVYFYFISLECGCSWSALANNFGILSIKSNYDSTETCISRLLLSVFMVLVLKNKVYGEHLPNWECKTQYISRNLFNIYKRMHKANDPLCIYISFNYLRLLTIYGCLFTVKLL